MYYLLLVFCAILCHYFTFICAFDNSGYEDILHKLINEDAFPSVPVLSDIETVVQQLLDAAHIHIGKEFSSESHKKRKERDITSLFITGVSTVNWTTDSRSNRSNFVPSDIFDITSLEAYSFSERHFLFLGRKLSQNQDLLEVTLSKKGIPKLELKQRIQLDSSISEVNVIRCILHNEVLWLALGDSTSQLVYVVPISMNNWSVGQRQLLPLSGPLGNVFFFELHGELHMMVANKLTNKMENITTNCDEIDGMNSGLYTLTGSYFDKRENLSMATGLAQVISGFSDGDVYYIVFGMKSSKGSHVYCFDPVGNTFSLVQLLPENNVTDVTIVDTYDQKKLLVVTGGNLMTSVYWWTGQHFLKWQNLSHVTDGQSVNQLSLPNSDVAIAVSSKSHVYFYSTDSTAHYAHDFAWGPSCSSISDVNLISLSFKKQISGLLTLICQRQDGKSQLVFAKVFVQHGMTGIGSSARMSDGNESCLQKLKRNLEDRQQKILTLQNVLDSDQIMTVDRPQVWHGAISFDSVHVNGTATVEGDIVGNSCRGRSQCVGITAIAREFVGTSYEPLRRKAQLLLSEAKSLEASIPTLLSFSGDQNISGNISMAAMNCSAATFMNLKTRMLKDLELSQLASLYLFDGVNQVIKSPVKVWSLDTINLTTGHNSHNWATINGNVTVLELLRKNIKQTVTGLFTFPSLSINSDVKNPAGEYLPIRINSVYTDQLVMHGDDVEFSNLLRLKNVTVIEEFNLDFFNGIPLNEETQNSNSHISSNIVVHGDLVISGNLNVTSLGGVNMSSLDTQTVKTVGNFNFGGPVNFRSRLILKNDLKVTEVENIPWEKIIHRNMSIVDANFVVETGRIRGNLTTDDCNGLDLSAQSVLTNRDQTVTGYTLFTNSVSIKGPWGLSIIGGVLINGVTKDDLQRVVDGVIAVEVEEEVDIAGIFQVKGNALVSSVNGLPMEKLSTGYWRKSVDQIVPVSVRLESANFSHEVNCATFNGNPVAEFLRTRGDQLITGKYIFVGPVMIEGNMKVAEHATISGVDVSLLAEEIITLDSDQIIHGVTSFLGHVRVDKFDLSGHLNNLSVTSDFVRLDAPIVHSGSLNFLDPVTVNTLNVNENVRTGTLNERDVDHEFKDILLTDEDIIVNGGLIFNGDLSVTNMTIDGCLDGINTTEIVLEPLRKQSSVRQQIPHWVIAGDVHFGDRLTVEQVNNKILKQYLGDVVDEDYSGEIAGKKTFTGSLSIMGKFDPWLLNRVDFPEWAKHVLSKSKVQNVSADYVFLADVHTNKLYAPIINGIKMTDIVLIDKPTVFSDLVIFNDDVVMQDLRSTNHIIDRCDLAQITETLSTLQSSFASQLNPNVDVSLSSLVVTGDVTQMGELFFGVSGQRESLNSFLNGLVKDSGYQNIRGNVHFTNVVSVDSLMTDFINDVDINDILNNALLKNDAKVINCSLVISDPTYMEDLIVKDLSAPEGSMVSINGKQVQDILSRAVRRNGTQVISGQKMFTKGLKTERLEVMKEIGGVFVRDLIHLKSEDDIMNVQFDEPIVIMGNLQVLGLIDSVNLTEFVESRIALNSSEIVYGDITFDELNILGDVITDMINVVSLDELVTRPMGKMLITGNKYFESGISVKGNVATAHLNGINVGQVGQRAAEVGRNGTSAGAVLMEQIGNLQNIVHELNEKNYADVAVLNASLSYLSREAFIPLNGSRYLSFQKMNGNSLFVTVQKNDSCSRETHELVVTQDGQLLKESVVKGYYQPVVDVTQTDVMFDFTTSCLNSIPTTLMRSLQFDNVNEVSAILNYRQAAFGNVMHIDHFNLMGVAYFVVASAESVIVNLLKYDRHFDAFVDTWKMSLPEKVLHIQIETVNNVINMLVTTNATARLFIFDEENEKFIENIIFSPAVSPAQMVTLKNQKDDMLVFVPQHDVVQGFHHIQTVNIKMPHSALRIQVGRHHYLSVATNYGVWFYHLKIKGIGAALI